MPMYHSPRGGLYAFQAQLASFCILRPMNLAVVDTGLGKTHIALATAAVLIEDGEIDHVVFACEQNKLQEWAADIAEFTDLSYMVYKGSPDRRRRIAAKVLAEGIQALVMTYQTAREDVASYKKRNGGGIDTAGTGPLTEEFRGKRMLIVYDEMTTLGGRTSQTYVGHRHLIKAWGARVLGMTATPVTNGPESYYNLGRLLCPEAVGTVEQFEHDHVAVKNQWHQATHYKNHELLAQKMSGVLLRKRKTDPDVIAEFPTTVDDFVVLKLDDDHQALYDELAEEFEEVPELQARQAFNLLRRFANHPMSIFQATGKIVDSFLARHSRDEIEKLRCVKSDAVVEQARRIVAQGDQALIFCDSTAVLMALAEDLAKAKISIGHYHGRVDGDRREHDKAEFKAGRVSVLLCSKMGERGINLPEASYVINYDVPLLHSSYLQRVNRASRIGHNAGGVLIAKTYVADGTVENGAISVWNRRNTDSDRLLDRDVVHDESDAFVNAQARMALLKSARKLTREEAA